MPLVWNPFMISVAVHHIPHTTCDVDVKGQDEAHLGKLQLNLQVI